MVYAIIIKCGESKKKSQTSKTSTLVNAKGCKQKCEKKCKNKFEKKCEKKGTNYDIKKEVQSSYCFKNNQHSILNYFDLKKKEKKKDEDTKDANEPNENVDDCVDNFHSIEECKNESKQKNEHIFTYIKWIYEEKKKEKENIKEHILKLLILLKKEDIYLKKYFPKVYYSELNKKKNENIENKLNYKEKIYINNIYNKNVKSIKFYSNIINNSIYEYKLTFSKENSLITFHYYDGFKKSFKISNSTFFYLISDAKNVFRSSSQNEWHQDEESTCLTDKNRYIYTFKRNCNNKINVEIIDVLSKTNKIEFSVSYTPLRVFYQNNHLFFVNIINCRKKSRYFTYSIYKNNVIEKIRVIYLSTVHPFYQNTIVCGNTFPFFCKCKYFYHKEKIFMWSDPLLNDSSCPYTSHSSTPSDEEEEDDDEETKLNKIPSMNIIHINSNVNICIAFEESTETYFFFHILYEIIKYNKKYLKDYFKGEKIDKFLPFQHFLSIEKNQFFYKNKTFSNINFNTEIYKPQLVLTSGGNKSISNRIKLCVYDNVNNLLFLIPIYHKYVRDKIKIVPNVLNFTAINMTREFSTFNYYPYNICAFMNNKINTTHLECKKRKLNLEHTAINVSTGRKRGHYFQKLLKTKMNILKSGEGQGSYNVTKEVTQSNIQILDMNRINNFIIILNKDGMLYLLSDDIYVSSIYLYNNKEQIYNIYNSDFCHVTVDTIDYDKKKICLNSYRVYIDILPKNPTLKFVLSFFYNYICKKIATQFFTLCIYECRKTEDNKSIFHFLNIDIYFLDYYNFEYSHERGMSATGFNKVDDERLKFAANRNDLEGNSKVANTWSQNLGAQNLNVQYSKLQNCTSNEQTNHQWYKNDDSQIDNPLRYRTNQCTGSKSMAQSTDETWIKKHTEKYKMFNKNFFEIENLLHIEFSRFVYLFMLVCVEDLKMYRKMEKYLYLKKVNNPAQTDEYGDLKFNCFKLGEGIDETSNTEEERNSTYSSSCNSDNKIESPFNKIHICGDQKNNITCKTFNSYYRMIENFINYLHNKYKHIYHNKYLILAYLHSYFDEISINELVEQKIKDDLIFIILILSYSSNVYNFMFHYMNKLSPCRKQMLQSFYKHICRKYYKEELLKWCRYKPTNENPSKTEKNCILMISQTNRCSDKTVQRGYSSFGKMHFRHFTHNKESLTKIPQKYHFEEHSFEKHNFEKYNFLNNYLKNKYKKMVNIPNTVEIINQIANCKDTEKDHNKLNHFLSIIFLLHHNDKCTKKLKLKHECYTREVEELFSIMMKEEVRKNFKKGKNSENRNDRTSTNLSKNMDHIKNLYKTFQTFKSSILIDDRIKFLYYFYPLYFPLKNLLIISYLSLFYAPNLKNKIMKDIFLRNVIKNELDVIYFPSFDLDFMKSDEEFMFQKQNGTFLKNYALIDVNKEGKNCNEKFRNKKEYKNNKSIVRVSKMEKILPKNVDVFKTTERSSSTSREMHMQYVKKADQQCNEISFYQKRVQLHTYNIKHFDSLNIDDMNIVNILLKCVFYENLYLLNMYSYFVYIHWYNDNHIFRRNGNTKYILTDAMHLKWKKGNYSTHCKAHVKENFPYDDNVQMVIEKKKKKKKKILRHVNVLKTRIY